SARHTALHYFPTLRSSDLMPQPTSRSHSSASTWCACIVDRAPSTSQSTIDRMSLLAITLRLSCANCDGGSHRTQQPSMNKLETRTYAAATALKSVPADLLVIRFTRDGLCGRDRKSVV